MHHLLISEVSRLAWTLGGDGMVPADYVLTMTTVTVPCMYTVKLSTVQYPAIMEHVLRRG